MRDTHFRLSIMFSLDLKGSFNAVDWEVFFIAVHAREFR